MMTVEWEKRYSTSMWQMWCMIVTIAPTLPWKSWGKIPISIYCTVTSMMIFIALTYSGSNIKILIRSSESMECHRQNGWITPKQVSLFPHTTYKLILFRIRDYSSQKLGPSPRSKNTNPKIVIENSKDKSVWDKSSLLPYISWPINSHTHVRNSTLLSLQVLLIYYTATNLH